jgi:hypothetical protein
MSEKRLGVPRDRTRHHSISLDTAYHCVKMSLVYLLGLLLISPLITAKSKLIHGPVPEFPPVQLHRALTLLAGSASFRVHIWPAFK